MLHSNTCTCVWTQAFQTWSKRASSKIHIINESKVHVVFKLYLMLDEAMGFQMANTFSSACTCIPAKTCMKNLTMRQCAGKLSGFNFCTILGYDTQGFFKTRTKAST